MAPAPAPSTRVASAAPSAQSDEGFFSSLARKVGFGATADTTVTAQPTPAKPRIIEAKRNETPSRPEGAVPKAAAPKAAETKAVETKQASARPPLKPSLSDPPAAAPPPAKDGLVAGSQPIMSANSFESRFSAIK
jgi:hypothetical protein